MAAPICSCRSDGCRDPKGSAARCGPGGHVMKAFVVDRYRKQAPLRLADMPTPEPREDEVLVEVHAAGVNLLDAKIRGGEFKLILPYRLPLILGHDVAGVVVKVGAQVRHFKPGDEVYARA